MFHKYKDIQTVSTVKCSFNFLAHPSENSNVPYILLDFSQSEKGQLDLECFINTKTYNTNCSKGKGTDPRYLNTVQIVVSVHNKILKKKIKLGINFEYAWNDM